MCFYSAWLVSGSRKGAQKPDERNEYLCQSPDPVRVQCRSFYTSLYLPLEKETFPFWHLRQKVVSFRVHFLLAQNQCYGWYYKPFLLRSDKTGKCALKSAVLTPVSSYLIQFTWNSMVNLTRFLLYFFLAVATNASCPLLAYCNCSCVSAGLLRFRDNLRKHLGLSAPVVLRNARRVPLQIFTSADTE